jgi:excisionase family DNA binding protein
MSEPDLLLTATEAATLLGVNRTHVHYLIERGELTAFKLPTKGALPRLYIPRGEVLALKERRQAGRRRVAASGAPDTSGEPR